MRICMAAAFDVKNKMSWSGTPLSLYNALCGITGNEIETVSLDTMRTSQSEAAYVLKYLDIPLSIKNKGIKSKLGPSAMNPLNSSLLNKYLKSKSYDAVIEFGGFVPDKNTPPYYIYTDSSRDMEIDFYKASGTKPFGAENYSDKELENASAYVKQIYQNAAGIFCMSNYLADSLINSTHVAPDKVHVVYAGANWHGVSIPDVFYPRTIEGKKEISLLLTGVTYRGKGVDIAIEAVKRLNKKTDMKYKLHICGIKELDNDDPNIICHGFTDKNTLVEILKNTDLFVLPSRYDCFGISFVEAMTFGIPCIGRNIMAMPEIIDEGKNGELVTSDDPDELAELINKICTDPASR